MEVSVNLTGDAVERLFCLLLYAPDKEKEIQDLERQLERQLDVAQKDYKNLQSAYEDVWKKKEQADRLIQDSLSLIRQLRPDIVQKNSTLPSMVRALLDGTAISMEEAEALRGLNPGMSKMIIIYQIACLQNNPFISVAYMDDEQEKGFKGHVDRIEQGYLVFQQGFQISVKSIVALRIEEGGKDEEEEEEAEAEEETEA